MSAEELPTPRTDEEVRANFKWSNGFGSEAYIPVKFARQLERELAQAKAELSRARADMKQMEKDHREDMRDAAAHASHSERYPDEPHGTY